MKPIPCALETQATRASPIMDCQIVECRPLPDIGILATVVDAIRRTEFPAPLRIEHNYVREVAFLQQTAPGDA
jgi:hypothetical protein